MGQNITSYLSGVWSAIQALVVTWDIPTIAEEILFDSMTINEAKEAQERSEAFPEEMAEFIEPLIAKHKVK